LTLEVISIGEPMVEFCATETGKLKDVQLFKRGWGGDTSNFIITVARQGRKGGYICRIGDDEFGESFLELWKSEGIDTSRVIIEKGGFTAVYFISLMPGGGHDFVYYRKDSAASHLSPSDIDEDYIRSAKVLHSSGISLAISRSCREAVMKAARIAKQADVMFSFDLNVRTKLWPLDLARKAIEEALKLSDIIFASAEDMRLLYGIEDPKEAIKVLMKFNPGIAVIKLGAKGCLVASEKDVLHLEGFQVNVVDTTGAGDAFDGAFIVGLLEGWDLNRTAIYANAVGALTTTGLGAVEPIPKRKEVEEFLKERNVS